MITSAQIHQILQEVRDEFLQKDHALLTAHAHERTITFRLGYYLQNRFPDWNVDCEYNRHGLGKGDVKRLRRKTIFPDIIVHRRGKNGQNFLVIEAKPSWASRKRKEADRSKLRLYRNSKYKYRYAYFLVYSAEPHPDIKLERI